MDLADHRDPVVGETLDKVHLPQRMFSVQRGAGNPSDRLVQLATAAGRGQPPWANVVIEVDVAVLPPHRMVQLERDVDELIAEWLEFVQPARDDPAKRFDIEVTSIRVQFDHGGFDGVHVHVRRFAVQQHRVPAAQPLHRCPLLIGRP